MKPRTFKTLRAAIRYQHKIAALWPEKQFATRCFGFLWTVVLIENGEIRARVA